MGVVQVSNWFINARVRLWKPMVEDMYQQEVKEAEGSEERGDNNNRKQQSNNSNNTSGQLAQTPTATTSTATAPPPPTPKRSNDVVLLINAASGSDPSLVAINSATTQTQSLPFSENQASAAAGAEVAPPPPPMHATHCFDSSSNSNLPLLHRSMPTADDTCRNMVTTDYGTTSAATPDMASTLIRFGTTSGDVSLTLGLRHAGNIPDTSPFSVRDFGAI